MLAKKVKQAMALIEKHANEVACLEVQKRDAIMEEDFDKANHTKESIRSIRHNLWNIIHEEGLDVFDEEV
jgi:hypothetical protein